MVMVEHPMKDNGWWSSGHIFGMLARGTDYLPPCLMFLLRLYPLWEYKDQPGYRCKIAAAERVRSAGIVFLCGTCSCVFYPITVRLLSAKLWWVIYPCCCNSCGCLFSLVVAVIVVVVANSSFCCCCYFLCGQCCFWSILIAVTVLFMHIIVLVIKIVASCCWVLGVIAQWLFWAPIRPIWTANIRQHIFVQRTSRILVIYLWSFNGIGYWWTLLQLWGQLATILAM